MQARPNARTNVNLPQVFPAFPRSETVHSKTNLESAIELWTCKARPPATPPEVPRTNFAKMPKFIHLISRTAKEEKSPMCAIDAPGCGDAAAGVTPPSVKYYGHQRPNTANFSRF
ncbi:hypothetical protein PLICRDRAFT_331767 [Plicaturopsis crispa FD-325 SS-3]|uniref:Uncharacterized protein n=1 Tax=Plicaturopsis crispa FD-325 SS-3 TaxID=944288 RepID=A0A0C9SYJ6_PLICR|nr:hypothetical protein PLICRDRAFT_331767 [Plicaturopsis crispa FD-325 SS-3]